MRACAGFLGTVFLLVALVESAVGVEVDLFRHDPGGRIQAVRACDADGDARLDLVLLLTTDRGGGPQRQELVVLLTPEAPTSDPFWPRERIRRIPLDEGPAARAGAVAVGAFGPTGQPRIRFLCEDGVHDLTLAGEAPSEERGAAIPSLLGRSPGQRIVFWDGHADLDGDGVEECWFPDAAGSGRVHVMVGAAAEGRVLDLDVFNRGATDEEFLFIRYARVPRLLPADLDGDGKRELVAWDGEALVAWSLEMGQDPVWRLPLPFSRPDLGPDEIHTPRIQIEDVDADGMADLLVTVVMGNRAQIGSFRTRLYHFPGPFADAATNSLVRHRVRIDTESVALHPRFVDIDGDGLLDYLIDSIHGKEKDLILRVLGQEPTIWHETYLFDAEAGTFSREPYFKVERPYSREEAVSNRFGVSAWFDGDFDGDGHKDLLDLGNLNGFEILGAMRMRGGEPGDPIVFARRLLARVVVEKALDSDAVVADLTGDGLADAAVWNATEFILAVPRRDP